MLSEEQWSDLEPLIEVCRPHAKVPSQHLRRTVEAILWRFQNGATWRSLPAEFGPWWMAAQTFIRLARLGVWKSCWHWFRSAASGSAWCSWTEPTSEHIRRQQTPAERRICTALND